MRFTYIFLLLGGSWLPIAASPTEGASPPQKAESTAREAALDGLLSERASLQALDRAIAEARKNAISEQAILEARFLYHVDHCEDEAIAKLLPEFVKTNETFKLENSEIFSVKEDWLAVIEYVRAIDSITHGDTVAFKNHITEAFWLSPKQAAAFAPHIDQMRLEQAMRGVKIDFSRHFESLANGTAVELRGLIKDQKALLLHFWSPRSRDCESSLPEIMSTIATLEGKGISAVSFIAGDSEKTKADANAMLKLRGGSLPGVWLIDSQENPLSRELRVQALPQVVIVSNDGRVLYNGDPNDDRFWKALHEINSQISRPEINESEE